MNNISDFLQTNWWWILIVVLILILAAKDIFFNRKHTIKHNFPVVGHIRYMLERIGPELRQYIVANNREELPFNRSARSWIYASSKGQNNYQGFGTDQDIYSPGHNFINPAMFPYRVKEGHPNYDDHDFLPCAKVIGEHHNRRQPFRPYSVVNISAMSYGALSRNAVAALNKGALMCGCYHNTGEGGLSPYHRHGADVMFHFGTGYFGVRDEKGDFSFERAKELVEKHSYIKSIEIKLSQGAKPGKGGVLPGSKITPEIALIRGVPMGKDVISPSSHSAFSNVPEMVEFIEKLADVTGLPVGIKSAVGKLELWEELAEYMEKTNTGPDFINIDGGEGGTGAAPPDFADHVSLPWVYAFSKVYKKFAARGIADKIVFMGAAKLGLPAKALMAFAMGADIINTAREPMMSIGCIQALKCHLNTCPAGVATSNEWLQAGLDVNNKAIRLSNYIRTMRKEMLDITHACGYEHPCQLTMEDVDISMGDNNLTQTLKDTYKYEKIPVPFTSMQDLKDSPYLGGGKFPSVIKDKSQKVRDTKNELAGGDFNKQVSSS